MVTTVEMLNANEAAVVAAVALRDVNRVIDERILPETLFTRDNGRRVSLAGCVFISFYFDTAARLTSNERLLTIREALPRFEAWRRHKITRPDAWTVRHDYLAIDLAPFAEQASKRLDRLDAAREMVVSDRDILSGTPVIRGTRIPVHDIAASVEAGASTADLIAAYSSLDSDKIELAVIYAAANPLMGRKRKSRLPAGARLISHERIENFRPLS